MPQTTELLNMLLAGSGLIGRLKFRITSDLKKEITMNSLQHIEIYPKIML